MSDARTSQTLPAPQVAIATVCTALFGVLLMSPDSALGARQENPLPVYTYDNDRFNLLYTSDGIRFEDRVYTPRGRGKYRYLHDPVDACPTDRPGRVVGELVVRGAWAEHLLTEYRGCGRRAKIWRRVKRRLFRAPFVGDAICKRQDFVFERKSRKPSPQRLTVTDRCDGTLDVRQDDESGSAIRVSGRRGRWVGTDLFLEPATARWQLKLRWKKGATSLRLKGAVRVAGKPGKRATRRRLDGKWTLLQVRAAAPPD